MFEAVWEACQSTKAGLFIKIMLVGFILVKEWVKIAVHLKELFKMLHSHSLLLRQTYIA